MIVLTILCVLTVTLGIYLDLFSWYCVIRILYDPDFRTSPVPLAGIVLYFMAGATERLAPWLFFTLCGVHLSMVGCYFLEQHYIVPNKHGHNKDDDIAKDLKDVRKTGTDSELSP